MKGKVVVAVVAAYITLNIGTASAYTALFAFGDSLSDAGNAFIATGGTIPPIPMSRIMVSKESCRSNLLL